MIPRRVMAVLLLLGVSAFAGGCQERQPMRHETFTINSPYAVLDTPALRQMKAEAPPLGGEQAWWTTRNDERLSVNQGYQSVEIVDYVVRNEDRQQLYSGQVNDTVRQTTQSSRYGRWVR